VGHQPRALDVQPDDRAEALRRDVLGRSQVLAAGVVHEQVDPAVALQDAVHQRLDLVLLADVARARLHPPFLGGRGRLVERLLAPPAHDDPRAQGGEL
jgi:hypothetical protein